MTATAALVAVLGAAEPEDVRGPLSPDVEASLADFGTDPLWLILLKAVVVFAFLVGTTVLMIWAERRVVARMQQRSGPNRAGPFGLGQSLADGIKLAFKEDIMPALADKPVYVLAPIVSATFAFVAFAVIPLGGEVSIFGERTVLQLADLPVALLFVLGIAAMGIYGIILAGWSSGSTYPLLGSLRSAAQVISYEVAVGLALVPILFFSQSLAMSEIVVAQAEQFTVFGLTFGQQWFAILLVPSFAIYCVGMVGETNRAPFDLPEAESELVGGFHTEYSSLKFAMFFLGEYINMVTVSAIAVTLFLGGWLPPWPLSEVPFLASPWLGPLWFGSKLLTFLFVFIWLRGTLPRMRYDQFMQFGWKTLIPFAVLWLMAVALVRTLQAEGYGTLTNVLVIAGVVLVVGAAVQVYLTQREDETPEERRERDATEASGTGHYPVPELSVQGTLLGERGARLPEPDERRSLTPASPRASSTRALDGED